MFYVNRIKKKKNQRDIQLFPSHSARAVYHCTAYWASVQRTPSHAIPDRMTAAAAIITVFAGDEERDDTFEFF